LMVDPDSIQGIVHAAMRKLQQREIIRLRVHSSAMSSIRDAIQRAGVGDGVEVVADPAMSVGDLIIETTRGELDASVGTQLQEIARGFADRLALP
jgi:flagellar biosynthesis/type III secretory pathway protein FliH